MPFSFRLQYELSPMIIWSISSIPSIFPLSFSLSVMFVSSFDGVGSPDG